MEIKRGTIKRFREYLNEKHKNSPLWKNKRYHQETRGYGDYLYSQDRSRFDYYLTETINGTDKDLQEEFKDFNK